MRKLLNTLYVTMPEAYLGCEGENVLIRTNDEIKFRVPVHNIEGIVCFTYIGASPKLMRLCCERGIGLSFLSPNGKFQARVSGAVSGNILLRKNQYRWGDIDGVCVRLAKRFVSAKLMNCRVVLHRAVRDHAAVIDKDLFISVMKLISNFGKKVDKARDLHTIRGYEGQAANLYFTSFDQLILVQKADFRMSGRNRRPPKDRVNALLSFLYTLLAHEMASALESVGLDPQAGFLHKDRPGRFSLALDVMEELRPYLADRLALNLINRNQINADGFVIKESGAVVMDHDTRKLILTAWQKRKQEEITHPYLQEKVPLGLLPYIQAMLLARHIRGDIEDYPPFIWK